MDIESLIAVVVVARSITRLAKAIESLDPDEPTTTHVVPEPAPSPPRRCAR